MGKAFKREISAQWTRNGPRPELREMVENAMKVLPDEVLDARVEDELESSRIGDEQSLNCC